MGIPEEFEMDFKAAEKLMGSVFAAAEAGIARGQSPFGAGLVDQYGDLVECGHNEVRQRDDPSAHAEVVVIRRVASRLGRKSLSRFSLFSTCEPCPMCASTIVLSGIRTVVFGASVSDARDAGYSELQIPCESIFKHASEPVLVHGGVLGATCREQLLRHGPRSLHPGD